MRLVGIQNEAFPLISSATQEPHKYIPKKGAPNIFNIPLRIFIHFLKYPFLKGRFL